MFQRDIKFVYKQYSILITKEIFMKYSLFAIALVVLMTACGEPKPGQKPPSLYKEREGLLSDSELDAAKKESAEQESN
jgi:hypothetical protein